MLRKSTKRESMSDVLEGDDFITTEVREPPQPTSSDSPLATEEVLRIPSLGAGEALTVKTRNSTYRFIVLDSTEQKILIRGGRFFHHPTEARLLGRAQK